MSKRDRQGVRTPADIERKYDLGKLNTFRGDSQKQDIVVNELTQKVDQFIADTNGNFETVRTDIDNIEKDVSDFNGAIDELNNRIDNLGTSQGGVSPTIDVADIEGGHRVTITDVNGTESFDVMDGAAGSPYTLLVSGTDFDTVLTPGTYIGRVGLGDGTNLNYLNSPYKGNADFTLEVLPFTESGFVMQRLTICSKGNSRKWERHYYSNSWGNWYCTYSDQNRVLWEGSLVMADTDSITLAEPISRQPSGVVLVFTRGNSTNNFNTFFLSKKEVVLHDGGGHTFTMYRSATTPFGEACIKYLYVNDTGIVGHTKNAESGTGACNIKYDNSAYMLRYVIGV